MITLQVLWNRYSRECAAFLDNNPRARADAKASVEVLKVVLGAHRDVRTITELDLVEYATKWLDHDPLEGLRFSKEKNPARPVSSHDRYVKTRAAVQELAAKATSEQGQLRWIRLEFALFLANATGRRRGAIVGLRVEDFDFVTNKVTWRAEYDKKGVEWVVPMPVDVMLEIQQYLGHLDLTNRFVFPSRRNTSGHIPPDMLNEWLQAAEVAAKLPKLKGGLWHPYRRKWAIERMHLPLKAVAAAGGWKDEATLIRCYQHPDEDTLRRVMANEGVRHSPALVAAAG